MTYNNLYPNWPIVQPVYVPPIQVQPVYIPQVQVVHVQQKTLGESFKPANAGSKTSHVVFILDDSGSMQSCRKQTIDGFNEFLKGQQIDAENTGIKTFVSLYKFDGSSVKCTINRTQASQVQPLDMNSYNPRGGTNLRDALGAVLVTINNDLTAKRKRDRDSVIITVLTDGEENSSRTFTDSDVKQMVEKAEGANWGFMFLGANIDAFAASAAYGFNQHNTVQFDTRSVKETVLAATAMTSRMKSLYNTGESTAALYSTAGFTDQERRSSIGGANVSTTK